jgi:hypothetical protein
MPIRKTKQINLIPQDEFEGSTTGRVLKWALSTFRVTVIITELIVMSAFLSRFWFDSRNSDLNDELNIKKSQVLAYSDIEKEFRKNQAKLSIVKSLYSENNLSNVVETISKNIPADVFLSSISVVNKDLNLKAYAFSEISIAQFLINLTNLDFLGQVSLNQVSSSVDNSAITNFTITAVTDAKQLGGNK